MCVCATVDDGQDQTIFLQLTYYVLRSSLAPVYICADKHLVCCGSHIFCDSQRKRLPMTSRIISKHHGK